MPLKILIGIALCGVVLKKVLNKVGKLVIVERQLLSYSGRLANPHK